MSFTQLRTFNLLWLVNNQSMSLGSTFEPRWLLIIPYCPSARRSSVKIWGWAVTQRTHLNGSTISAQGPTPDAKLAAMGLNGLASSVCQLFVKASPTVAKAASCYKADRLVASLLSFCSVQSLLAVREFHAAGEERYKQGHGWVCANLWCLMLCRSTNLRTFRFTTTWWVVTRRTLKNHKTVKIGGWTLARVWVLARDIR